MAQIHTNNQISVVMICVALGIVLIVGVCTANFVAKPILRLNASTQALGRGEWQQVKRSNFIKELDDLTLSYNSMVVQLKDTMDSLTSEIEERERAEEELSMSRERLKAVFSAAENVSFIITDAGDPVSVVAVQNETLNDSVLSKSRTSPMVTYSFVPPKDVDKLL